MTKTATAFEEEELQEQFVDDTWDDGGEHGEVVVAGEDREEAVSFGAKRAYEGASGDLDAIKLYLKEIRITPLLDLRGGTGAGQAHCRGRPGGARPG